MKRVAIPMYEVSVIIPVLNEGYYLERLLKALHSQEDIVLDVIVADAGSKDNSKRIAKKYGARIVEGGLHSVGRNNDAKAAKYERLLFLDADANFHKQFIKNCIKHLVNKKIEVASVLTKPDFISVKNALLEIKGKDIVKMGKIARRNALNHFDIKKIVKKTEEVYNTVLK